MGLAVLPPRLATELEEVRAYLLDQPNQIAAYHIPWAQEMKETYTITEENVTEIVYQEVGGIFAKVWNTQEFSSEMHPVRLHSCVLSINFEVIEMTLKEWRRGNGYN